MGAKPTGPNIDYTRKYTTIIDGSNIYQNITIPSNNDCTYAAFQSPFEAVIISSGNVPATQEYVLYGGKLPYNVYAVNSAPIGGSLPESGSISSSLNFPLDPGPLDQSNFIFSISKISAGKYNIDVNGGASFGITRFEFYDFEGERREQRDFILNPELRNESGVILSDTTINLTVGDSIDLNFYAGFDGDNDHLNNKVQPINWDVFFIDEFDDPISVVGSGVSMSVIGPTTTLNALASGTFTLSVSRLANPLVDTIIAEGVPITSGMISSQALLTILPSGGP